MPFTFADVAAAQGVYLVSNKDPRLAPGLDLAEGTVVVWGKTMLQKQSNIPTDWIAFSTTVGPATTTEFFPHTITPAEAAAKSFALPSNPSDPAKVFMIVQAGGGISNGPDFSVVGNVVNWAGLSLDNQMPAGTMVFVAYNST